MIGSINCYVACPCIVRGRRHTFDGTIKGLVRKAVESGTKHGDSIKADFGAGYCKYILYAAPYDDRAYGFWAQEQR